MELNAARPAAGYRSTVRVPRFAKGMTAKQKISIAVANPMIFGAKNFILYSTNHMVSFVP